MLYTFYGNDTKLVREKASTLIASLLAKKPEALHIRITESEWTNSTLTETIESQGLFSDKLIVQFDNLLGTAACESIIESISNIQNSQNIFVFVESALDAKSKKILEKYSEKIQEHLSSESEEKAPTLFALADAFGRRDKKMLWVEFQKAVLRGTASEEIHGMIFWQLKSMCIASKTNSVESGLKPFVYTKSKQYSKNFTEQELSAVSGKLVSMYHDAHRGLVDFKSALEIFVLEI